MNAPHFNQVEFLKSAANLSQLPPDVGVEVAFVGRSNAGKSSAINAITGISALAKKSKTPGRTQLINFFKLSEDCRLVDLPGYGYAKVPEAVRLRWQETLGAFLQQRQCLTGIILLADIRQGLTSLDQMMLELAASAELDVLILLTKCDKISRGAANNTLLKIRKSLSGCEDFVKIQSFSATKLIGVEEARLNIQQMLNIEAQV